MLVLRVQYIDRFQVRKDDDLLGDTNDILYTAVEPIQF